MPISTPISNPVVNQRDIVIVQRANDNASYGEIHISGSDLIIYVDANGYVNADKSASFYATFPPPPSGLIVGATYQITASSAVSASWAPSTPSDYSVSASWASASLISVSSSWSSASLFSTTAGSASWASASLIAVSSSWASSSLSASVVRLTQYQFGFGSYPGNLLTSNGNFTTDGNNVMSVTGRFDIDGYQLWTKQSSIPGGGATYDALWAGTNGHIMANDGTTTWDLTNAVSASYAPPFALDSLTDVTITNPQLDDLLGWNGVEWVNKIGGSVSAGSGVNLYLDTTDAIGGNESLLYSPSTGSQEEDTASISNETKFIQRFITPAPIMGNLDAGAWVFHTYARQLGSVIVAGTIEVITRINRASELTGSVSLVGTGLYRTASFTGVSPLVQSDTGSDASILTATLIQTPSQSFWITSVSSSAIATCQATDILYANETSVTASLYYHLFSTSTGDIETNTITAFDTTTFQPQFTLPTGSKIVAAYFAKSDTVAAATVAIYHGGTSSYSHITTPLITRHNDLAGLQGGASNEYYHLTGAEYITLKSGTSSYASFATSASWAPGGGSGTTLYTGSTYEITASSAVSASWATTASYANYATTVNRAIVLCSAFTPTGSGADVGEMPVPYSGQSGLTPVTWSVKRIVWRASTTGINSSSINIEKSIGVGSFSATTLGSATLVSGAYEVVVTGSLGTVISGDKLRFNVTTLGSAQYWTILTEVLSS